MTNPENSAYLLGAIFGERPSLEIEDMFVFRPLLDEALSTLTPREEKVIKMRFGVGRTGDALSQSRVATHFAVSSSRIREIESKGLRKLRHPSRSRKLKNIFRILEDPALAEELDMQGLSLTEVPESVLKFRNVRTFAFSNNNLSSLPLFMELFKKLTHLYLDNNSFSEVPDVLRAITELQSLSLENNHLAVFPEYSFPKLTYLNLSHNRLAQLPEKIGQLANLRELNLIDNKITTLPRSIGRLKHLRRLNLNSNELVELPDTIGQLNELQVLEVTSNALTSLPEAIRQLSSLQELYVHGNKLPSLPIEVLGPWPNTVSAVGETPARPQDVLEYYFRVRSGASPLNEAKLILVGRGAVGKTSIVNRLVHDIFQEEEKTEGIKITEWSLPLGGDNVRLNIWDFGGQEIMHATHQFFLTQRSLYLLVLNGREGFEDIDAEYWLRLIGSFAGDSPVIIVLNKIKEHEFDLNRRALQQKYPAIHGFVKTDCKKGTGSKQLRRLIERETSKLEHLHDPFPSTWFAIKDTLALKRKNFLSFNDYRKLCARLGETNEHSQDTLASYLHSLGVALNFKDDPRLRDTHVLSPRWITDGIYKIINSRILAHQKGIIHLSDLSSVLDARKYPVPMHRFLLDLMKKFELCFSFPEDDTRYLIPELLDKQEPNEASEVLSNDCLNFRYDYPVMPEGLLPRFIVRTHVLSENMPRWRTGVIVTFEGARALVKADIHDRRVAIAVSGSRLSRRRLLAVIRSDFEHIHRDIRNLQPEEMVPLPSLPNEVVSYKELVVMEQKQISNFPKVVGSRVHMLNVDELLNGVDLDVVRRTHQLGLGSIPSQPCRLFCSYSHKDEGLRERLETHLKLLNRQRLIESWNDRKIDAGEDWKNQINENLERADIILLLVSADFLSSDYCYETEMKRALERHEKKEARVIPVIVRDVNWTAAPFAHLQALPKNGKAVTKWSNRDSAWRNVSEGIEKVVKELSYRENV